ncbi:hypothetical protein Tco_1368596 [Tanacetum coccineum]
MSCLPVFVDILVQTKWLMRMFLLLPPQDQMIRFFFFFFYLPFAAWVPIGKSNHVLDLQKRQKNLIFQIDVDILQNTNFFRAFTTSASVPAIYIQQFWNTLTYVEKARTYRFQLDENWFTLDANLLREALEITPIDQAHPFVSPPSGDAIMDFVNELGYPEVIHFVSSMAVNHLYQPWRAILSMINQCLTGKTSGHDRPRYLVLQMLWGIITSTNVDYAELMWEEFVQAMQTFLTDKANLGSPTKKGRKDKPHVIPYCRFTKLIICHLGRIHNIHQRSASPFHLAEEDLRLGNLKFVSKGKIDEVFGMPIPNELISNNIRNASYYNAYLEMVAKHDQKVAAEKEGKKKSASTKQPMQKPAIEIVMQSALTEIKMSLESFQAQEGKGKAIVTKEQAAQSLLALHTPKRRSTTDQFLLQRQTPTTDEASTGPSTQPLDDTSANIIRDSPSLADAETCARFDKTSIGGDTEIVQITEELGEDVEKLDTIEEKMMELDQDQAGSDTDETPESRPQPKQVQESLKFPADEHVILEDPLSLTGTLSSTRNLEDAYTIWDQFINDKSTNDEPGKLNVEAEVVSMVTVPIYQALSYVPPLITPLAERVAVLEKKLSDLEHNNKNLDNTTRNLGSSVYTLELRDLPHKINEAVHENVKEAVQIALQAPFQDHFRDLSEEDIKEMLHQRMFKLARTNHFWNISHSMKLLRHLWNVHRRISFSLKRISLPQAHQSSAWKKSNTRDAPLGSSKQQSGPHAEQPSNALATMYQAPAENSLLAKTRDMRTFINWYFQKIRKTELTQADLEGRAYEVANLKGGQFRIDISKPLPLSGPPGHVTIQTQFFFSKDLDYLHYGSKGSKQALSISKMKVARYHDFGLELLIPEHMWIDDVWTYDISVSYVVFPVSNNERKIVWFNEIYKFSDGILTNNIEAVDYRVKEYKVNRLNPGMNTWFWTDKDVERSKEFTHAIEHRLKTGRIFQNLECFVGARVRNIDYRLLQRTE